MRGFEANYGVTDVGGARCFFFSDGRQWYDGTQRCLRRLYHAFYHESRVVRLRGMGLFFAASRNTDIRAEFAGIAQARVVLRGCGSAGARLTVSWCAFR